MTENDDMLLRVLKRIKKGYYGHNPTYFDRELEMLKQEKKTEMMNYKNKEKNSNDK